MSEALYHRAILDLARAAHGAGRLAQPDGAVTIDNPLCGDRVTLGLRMRDGVVADLAHRVRGCTLCEAAAAAIGKRAPGAAPAELRAAAAATAKLLAGNAGDSPEWAELAVFRPVREHRSRHRCVLLPFEALVEALERAGATK
jgi:nitrogen fixation NifU-like protein